MTAPRGMSELALALLQRGLDGSGGTLSTLAKRRRTPLSGSAVASQSAAGTTRTGGGGIAAADGSGVGLGVKLGPTGAAVKDAEDEEAPDGDGTAVALLEYDELLLMEAGGGDNEAE